MLFNFTVHAGNTNLVKRQIEMQMGCRGHHHLNWLQLSLRLRNQIISLSKDKTVLAVERAINSDGQS